MKRRILAGAGLTFLLVVGVAAGSTTTAVRALAFGGPIRVVYPLDYGSGDVVSIALGDLSGDGRPDMAIASAEDNAVYVVLNRGRGRFRTVAKTDAPAGYSAIADVNGDGKQDLVVMSGLTVSVLLNRGDGTLLPRVDYAVGQVAGDDDALALGDLNGDGRPDIVAGTTAVRRIVVLLNNGDGTFASAVSYPTAPQPLDIELGDLNSDGKLDVVAAGYSTHAVSVLSGNGDGTLGAGRDYATEGDPVSVALADFNGDGKLDLATGNCCAVRHGISFFRNRGDGTFAAPRDYAAGEPGEAFVFLDASDMNGDGTPDFVYWTAPLVEQFRLNRGAGQFEPQLTEPTSSSLGLDRTATAIGDLNGDHRPDTAYATLYERNGDWNAWVRLQNPNACDVQPERGQTLAFARRTLALSNCRVGRIGYAHSTKVRRGRVLSQEPGVGVWRKGKRVDLVVSLGR